MLPAWVAEMDFPLAEPVKLALRARSSLTTAATPPPPRRRRRGLRRLRRAPRWGGASTPAGVARNDVVAGITALLRAIAEPGERVVITPPVYHPFFARARKLAASWPRRRLSAARARSRSDRAAFAEGAVALILCSPHNPTGGVPAGSSWPRSPTAAAHGAWVLADEIHAPLTLPGAGHVPFLTVSEAAAERGIAFCSASKTFNLAGLDCAQIVTASEQAAEVIGRLPFSATHCGHLGAIASAAAFRDGDPGSTT